MDNLKVTPNTPTAQPVRILIVGAGAVGCFYGSRMHHPPNALVSLVCRSNFNAVKRSGGVIKLQTRNFGDYVFRPEFVFSSVEQAGEARVKVPEAKIPGAPGAGAFTVAAIATGVTPRVPVQQNIPHAYTPLARSQDSPNKDNDSSSPIPMSSSLPILPSDSGPSIFPTAIFPASSLSPSPSFPPSNPSPASSSAPSPTDAKIIWDYVVITTKALPDISDDSSLITRVVHPRRTTIVLIQNGVGVEDPYCARFPENCVLSAVTVVSAEQVEPGIVVQNRWTRISIGPYYPTDTSSYVNGEAKTLEFVELLKLGGVKDAEVYSQKALQQIRWHKIAINGSMNPSAVLSSGTENARMVKDPELRSHLKACMEEVFHAAHVVLGEPLPSNLATADQIIASTERNTGGRPSMLVDWEKGHPMELEVILGNPIRIARSRGVEMPRLQAMYALLKTAQTRRGEERKLKSTTERSRL